MIHSAVVSFAACGLAWQIDLPALADVQGLDPDRQAPEAFPAIVLSCRDGRGQPVHPRYFQSLLKVDNTRSMILAAALRALSDGARRIFEPPTGAVRADPELADDPATALERFMPANGPHKL